MVCKKEGFDLEFIPVENAEIHTLTEMNIYMYSDANVLTQKSSDVQNFKWPGQSSDGKTQNEVKRSRMKSKRSSEVKVSCEGTSFQSQCRRYSGMTFNIYIRTVRQTIMLSGQHNGCACTNVLFSCCCML